MWIVSEKRFMMEFRNHVANIPLKYVNWMHDADNVMMYITTQGTNEIFCYRYPGSFEMLKDTKPALLGMLKSEGHILGIVEDNKEIKHGLKEVVTELKKLKPVPVVDLK